MKLEEIQDALLAMSPEERVEFISRLMAPYCRHCGTEDPDGRCQC